MTREDADVPSRMGGDVGHVVFGIRGVWTLFGCQPAAGVAHCVGSAAARLRMAAWLWRALLRSIVSQLRRCSVSAAATSGMRMQ
jgi:hypothetical protein